MRKTIFLILWSLMLGTTFTACNTEVDLYSDYKNITVVYGLLDFNQDTNYIKINKAFLGPGNALEIALIADSSEYPGKLDAKIVEYRARQSSSNYVETRTLPLDTITIANKEPGVFYSPYQKVYFTPERIKSNYDPDDDNGQFKYKYKLLINRGDTILTSETDIVGGGNFGIQDKPFAITGSSGKIVWYECPNAAVYDVSVKFYFTEYEQGQSRERCMKWHIGTYPETALTQENGKYVVSYNPPSFITQLANYLGDDTLKDISRVVSSRSIGINIAVGGEDLYQFMSVNGPSSSLVQNIPDYTNVNGGFGIFSSRAVLEQMVRLSSLNEITRHESWHFRQGK